MILIINIREIYRCYFDFRTFLRSKCGQGTTSYDLFQRTLRNRTGFVQFTGVKADSGTGTSGSIYIPSHRAVYYSQPVTEEIHLGALPTGTQAQNQHQGSN